MISKGKVKKITGSMDIGIMILLVFIVVFFGRCIYILKNNNERGGLAYVELLNFSMPLIETQVYDEGAYYENNLSLKNIALEALGLSDISGAKLINSEIPMFKLNDKLTQNDQAEEYTPFQLNDGAVSRYTEEEKSNLYNPKLKKELNKSKPEVLIYHTHSGENYAESEKSTNDQNYNVVGVGNVIEKELEEKYGISVIHDKTIHDTSYNDSYNRSRETVKGYAKKYNDSFKLVIDMHRDGVDLKKATQKTKDLFTTSINGESMAKIMYVNSISSSKFKANDKLEKELSAITNELYPGLARKTYTYNRGINSFNQDIFSNSILIEVGANINTSKEAMTSGKYIARIIAEYINGK
ncbi:stage II sporulation protein P [Clostridium sardiniense]|uniref:stage II sporulation protein P n=1 Tax=Clostridium sardiniense TaxID=29369 RepID=UPI003D34039F